MYKMRAYPNTRVGGIGRFFNNMEEKGNDVESAW